jgi:hypothetical protein
MIPPIVPPLSRVLVSDGHTPDAQVLGGRFARKCLNGCEKCCVTSENLCATLCNTGWEIKDLPPVVSKYSDATI